MKKLVLTLSSLALLFAAFAMCSSCSDHDIWADGCPYTWDVTDNQMLYCLDKSMTVEEYKDKLCGRVWELVEMRDISSDLSSYSDRKTFDGMVGWGGHYLYFTETECIGFCYNMSNPFFSKYLYTKAPVEVSNDGKMVSYANHETMGVIMGMRKDGRLEVAESTPHYEVIDFEHYLVDYNQLLNCTYTYRVYELCDNIDIDEVMAKGVTREELNEMIREYDRQQ